MISSLRVASVNLKIRTVRGDGDYFGHLHDLISQAHEQGAEVVVLPELHGLELLSIERNLKEHQAPRYLVQYAEAWEKWLKRISDTSGMWIFGGSHFKEVDGRIQNVAAIAVPGHDITFAAKNNLTRYEREIWDVQPGRGLIQFAPKLGLTICYDSEFPEAVRALAETGVEVLAVPSWTETVRGYQRVRWSCLARALENQIFVIHSALVGGLGYEPIPDSYGASAIIAPSVEPFAESAVLAETDLNEEGIAVADLNFEALHEARNAGEVSNWKDRADGDWTVRTVYPSRDVDETLN